MFNISWSNLVFVVLSFSAVIYIFSKVRANNLKQKISFAELQYAIEVHSKWKNSFQRYLTASIHGSSTLSGSITNSESFDPQIVEQDNQCALGKWLYNCQELKETPEYVDLLETHRDFHRQAAQVLQLSLDGKHKEVIQQFSQSGDFQKQSVSLSRQLVELYEKR